MTISYTPSKDELMLKFRPVKKKPTKELGRFKLWYDIEGNIFAIAINRYTQELDEFKKSLHTARLGGIWKGVQITGEDIKEARKELLQKLEEEW